MAALALLAGALLAALLADELDGAGADELVEADLLLLHAVMTRAAATVRQAAIVYLAAGRDLAYFCMRLPF